MRRIGERLFAFWWGQGIADDVPALTYYLLLSLGPTALGIAAVEGLLLGGSTDALRVADTLNRFLPSAVHEDIERLVVGAQNNSPLLLALAVAAMLWTTSGGIGVIERVESRLLQRPRHNVVVGRLRNMALGAGVGAALLAGAAGAPVIGEAARALRVQDALPGGLGAVVATAGSIAIFAIVFRFAPRTPLHWRAAFVGAVPAGVAMQVVPAVLGLYFGAAAGLAVVRVFLLLAVLLLGLYVIAGVILTGAGLAVQSQRRAERRAAARRRARLPAATAPGTVAE